MTLIVITVDRDLLPEHTDEQFEEWLRFEIGDRGEMSAENPLTQDLEAELKEWG